MKKYFQILIVLLLTLIIVKSVSAKNLMETNNVNKYIDENTGQTIWQLTNVKAEVRHTYYDVNPWNPDDSKIVFSVAEQGSDTGSVYIMDENGENIKLLVDDAAFSPHTGARALWGAKGEKVYFNSRRVSGGKLTIDSIDINTMKRRQLLNTKLNDLSDLGEMMLAPDGRKIAFCGMERNPKQWSIFTIGVDGENLQKIASTEEIRNLSPASDKLEDTESLLMHPKWNPDGNSLFIVHSNEMDKDAPRVKELYFMKSDGSEKSYITDFAHHPSWHPDGQHILFYDYLDGSWSTQRLFSVDKNGKNKRVLVDKRDAGTHPSYNPQGTKIITDCYRGGPYDNSIILIDPESDEIEKLATVKYQDNSHQGTHMHPVWNHSGTKILYNSDQTGHGQLYLLDLR